MNAGLSIPAVATVFIEDQLLAGIGPEQIQLASKPVEGNPQGIFGIGAGRFVTPEKFDKLLLGNRSSPMADQIGQQGPDLPGTVIFIRDKIVSGLKGKRTQHTDVNMFHGGTSICDICSIIT